MNKPLFSIVLIARNEEKTLPKLIDSLKEYLERGGKVFLTDTGSTDKTVEIARSLGCVVNEVGSKFIIEISSQIATEINDRFLVQGEQDVVKKGDKLFNFASARNCSASFAETDMIATMDADEAYSKLDIDTINKHIENGIEQFEYQFVFAHDGNGKPLIQFIQSKFYNRQKIKWVGTVHEVLQGEARRLYLDTNTIFLEHWQNQETNRSQYLTGLAYDCYLNPDNDRNSHYFARELMYTGRFKSAIKEFKRHITMNGWPAEAAQSMIYIGDCCMYLGQVDEALGWYVRAFDKEPHRREPLMKLAEHYYRKGPQFASQAIIFAEAALQVRVVDYYSNYKPYYENLPHEVLYWAYWQIGDKEKSKEHYDKAFATQPTNGKYIADRQFYYTNNISNLNSPNMHVIKDDFEGEYKESGISGWMSLRELNWLYEQGKKYDAILELGSWKGRSTHALCSGQLIRTSHTKIVIAVDTWQGSEDVGDDTNRLAKLEDVFAVFENNTKDFLYKNLFSVRKKGLEAVRDFEDKRFDMVFIDAGHSYEEVLADIKAWLPKTTKILCGHDYLPGTWMGVIQAVDEIFGKPDGVCDTIWYVDLSKRDPNDLKRILKKNSKLEERRAKIPQEVKDKVEKVFRGIENAGEIIYNNSEEDNAYVRKASIPKRIFTVWLSEDGLIPEGIQKCINSQKELEKEGYEHKLITLANINEYDFWKSKYAQECINSPHARKKWCKLSDYLRMQYLYTEGGIYLDADVEILPGKNFDDMLHNIMFAAREENGFIGSSVVASAPKSEFVKEWIRIVETNFRGDDEKNFESSMEILTNLYFQDITLRVGFCLYPTHHFFPYNHQTGQIKVTDDTRTFHHFFKTWVDAANEKLPLLTIVVPQLGRPEGLKRCLDSIDKLYYPKHLIKTVIVEGDETVPQKVNTVAKTVKQGWLVYAANDMEFLPDTIWNAIRHMIPFCDTETWAGLIAFNEGELLQDKGNICTHFMIHHSLIRRLGDEVFSEKLQHVGVDNLLWAKCRALNEASYNKSAKIIHHHYSRTGEPMDNVYVKGWKNTDQDRAILAEELAKI